MNLENIESLGYTGYWIPAVEHKKFRRIYFTLDSIYVIKTLNDRLRLYLTVSIVAIFLFLSGFFSQSVIISGFLWGLVLSILCGGIVGTFVVIVIITLQLWSIENKLNNLSPHEILNLDKDNYLIKYADISNIETKPLPRSLFKNEGELLIVAASGTYKLFVSQDYFQEIEEKSRKIKEYIPKRPKARKKLKLKDPIK